MRPTRSTVLDAAVRGALPLVLVFAAYLLFAGHNQPGGGFIAGLVGASALVLQFVASGLPDPRPAWLRPHLLIGFGLLIGVAVAASGWIVGDDFLDMVKIEVDLPVLGTAKTTTALFFEIGIFSVVVGMMVAILDGLGGTLIDAQGESGPGDQR